MEKVVADAAYPLNRMKDVPNAFLGISWYADYPDHYAGDARTATREKGEALREISVSALAEFIARVKGGCGPHRDWKRSFLTRRRTDRSPSCIIYATILAGIEE